MARSGLGRRHGNPYGGGMGDDDRSRWDERYCGREPVPLEAVAAPTAFADLLDRFPSSGAALDLACGDGRGAVWLARRGLDVMAVDVSPEAIVLADDLVRRAGVDARCRLTVADLDEGLPPGPPVDVVLCHLFNAPHLDEAVVDRLRPGGLLAVAVLSEVGAGPGRFRARPGELLDRFGGRDELELLDHREADGVARLLARRTCP
jgi:SAM-dependent methyltransferase